LSDSKLSAASCPEPRLNCRCVGSKHPATTVCSQLQAVRDWRTLCEEGSSFEGHWMESTLSSVMAGTCWRIVGSVLAWCAQLEMSRSK
jgi:hypothetical protein